MSYSNGLEQEILDYVFGSIAMTLNVGTYYVALSTADPGEAGAGMAEPVGNNYARQTIANSSSGWNNASGTSPTTKTNKLQINFPVASGSWGTITHFAIFTADNPPGGSLVASGALSVSRLIGANDQLVFPAGTLSITLD